MSIWNNCRRKGAIISLIGLALMINACAQPRMQAKLQYDIGFMNYTGQKLDNVAVYYGNTEVGAKGVLVKNGRATYGSVTIPIPSEAEVRWDEGDKHYAVKAKLEEVVPKGFGDDGTIYFVINTNGTVDVKPIKFDDTDAVVKLEKAVHPAGEYRLGFVNKTGRDLQAVSVYYGSQLAGSSSNILARVRVGYSDALTLPFPPEVEVRWMENNTNHAVNVRLDGAVPKGYADGTIFFVFKGDETVEVKPIKWNDSEGAVKLVK